MFLGAISAAHFRRQLLPAPAIAHRDGHGPLGVVLADDVPIELGDDLPRRQVAHGNSSTTMLVFV